MDDDDFYIDHQGAKMLFEAMMYAGGFRLTCRRERRYSSSPDLSPIRKRSISPEGRKGEKELLPSERFQGITKNYFEIAQQNAEELIKEEEEAKMKADKKKAKKERQKLKKQQAKENNSGVHNTNNDNITNIISSDLENLNMASASEQKESEGLDVTAAFVCKAVKKAKSSTIISDEPKAKQEVKDINRLIIKAQEYENSQHYKEAVQYLSDAINLKPQSIDLILKRSFLYFELAKFEKSIRDAKKVIQYAPNNPHAFYRLGEGHFALSNLTEAEAAFKKLLTLKTYCEEAKNRIFSIRIKQLEEMGYHPNEAFAALTKSKNKSLDEAIDFLNELEKGKHTEDLYYSDEDDEEEEDSDDDDDDDDEEESGESESASGPSSSSLRSILYKTIEISNKSPLLTDPKNPVGCSSLFVGNLKKDITYKELQDVFVKFGEIKTIKLTTEPNCYAFVNYEEPSAAGQAMAALQGSRWLLSTVPLIIKYPINVIKSLIPTMKNPEAIMHQLSAPPPAKKPTPMRPVSVASDIASEGDMKPLPNKAIIPVVQKPMPGKPRPPPKTEECFYWRTMGCSYGKKCFNLHIPKHKGIDIKPPKKLYTNKTS